jgi:hypothetical protein
MGIVDQHCLVLFSTGKRCFNNVWCDMVSMDACHLLLGRPWQYNRNDVHDRPHNMLRGDHCWEQRYIYVIFILVYGEKREGDWREGVRKNMMWNKQLITSNSLVKIKLF